MSDGGLAIAVLIILGFAAFILWAKTPHGKQTLHETFGAPSPKPMRKRRSVRRRPAAPGSRAKTTAAKKTRR